VDALLAAAAEEPGDERGARGYRDHQEELARPERVVLRHILTGDRQSAEAARDEILAGADFAAVAQRVSEDPSAPRGGYQGEVAIEDLPLPFAAPVAELPPGQPSEVFEASDGFHLFLVERRLPRQVPALEEVAAEVREELRRERGDTLLRELAEAARDRYNVELYPQNLPFHYQGTYSDDATSVPES
jgi:parvulin-like peptidyl-prolyl isomerase